MARQEQDLGKIRVKLASSGYTPGRKEIAPLLSLFGDADEGEKKNIVQALTRTSFALCMEALATLKSQEGSDQTQARVAISRACHAFSPTKEMVEHCLADLRVQDESTFRAALRIAAHIATEAPSLFGGAGATELAPVLRARFETGSDASKRAIVRVFGTLAREEDKAWLTSFADAEDGELARLARRSKEILERRLRRDPAQGKEAGRKLPVPDDAAWRAACDAGDLRLKCKRGLEGWIYRDLKPWLATAHRLEGHFKGTTEELFSCRMFESFAFVIRLQEGATLEEKIKRTLLSKPFETITRAFGDQVVFRLQLKGKGHQRALVWAVAEWCSAQNAFFRNDSRDAGWMLVVDEKENECELVPRIADPRFVYRTKDVPAASHPTVAAALATMAHGAWRGRRDLSLVETVWDPFAGSGLELIEYAQRNPSAVLVGTDISEEAEIAFHANIEASQTHAAFHRVDARTVRSDLFPHSPTLLLTNPPLGHRVPGDVGSLAEEVLRLFASLAAREARIVWISPDRNADVVCASLGFRKEHEKLVDLGGILRPLQFWARHSSS